MFILCIRSLENWNIENGDSEDETFDTSKPGNFDSLSGNFYYETVTLKLIEEGAIAKIKCSSYFSHLLDDRYGTSPEALGPADIVIETQAKNCSKS